MKALLRSAVLVCSFLFAVAGFAQAGRSVLPSVPEDSLRTLDLLAMPPAYSYQRLGMFCKLDVQLERRFKMPVMFRLGDVRQVEALEGKGPLALPYRDP